MGDYQGGIWTILSTRQPTFTAEILRDLAEGESRQNWPTGWLYTPPLSPTQQPDRCSWQLFFTFRFRTTSLALSRRLNAGHGSVGT